MIRNVKMILYSLLFVCSYASADLITIYNTTTRDLCVAVYYLQMMASNAQCATPISYIAAGTSAQINRPDRWFGYDRELVFVEDQTLLTNTLAASDLNAYHSKNVGDLQGSTFYLGDNSGDIYGYTVVEWDVVQVPLEYAQQELISMLPAIGNNPYKDTSASVRIGNDLSAQEQDYLAQRILKIRACLNQFCQQPLNNNVPSIALVCSGGGYRAMLYATGALKALDELQLMDGLSYVVGLSGSTWAIGSWISSGKSIQEFHDWVIHNIDVDMTDIDDDDVDLIADTVATKYASGQPFGFVDLYGACIANDLFDFFTNDKDQVYLSDQSTRIADGSLPLPIYTAISGESNASERLWYEFTPHEVGAPWLNAYVPTWAFGRKFNNGVSVTNAPEQTLGTMLGTFGLAVGVTLENLLQQTDITQNLKSALLKNILARITAQYGNDRAISAEYFNFVFGLPNTYYNNLAIAQLVDAGIDINLPYPPISGQRPERKADIIIFVDASAGTVGAELQNVENYARVNNLPFPVIDYTNIGNNAVSIFTSVDPQVPIVIYIPRIVDQDLLDAHQNDLPELYNYLKDFDIDQCCDDGACNTFNFSYTSDQARQMTALGEFNMLMAKDIIAQAVTVKSAL